MPALGQGGDECSTATVITGNGPHSYDQTVATPSADLSLGCSVMNADVWFAWTASQTVDHLLSACGASHDTMIAVFDSCGGTEIACNDDSCGLQSELSFAAVSGTTYYLRIGTYGTVPGNVGTITVTPDLPTINPNDGHAYKLVSGTVDWQTAKAEAENSTFNGAAGYLVTFTDQAELDWVVANVPGVSTGRPWIGLFQDLNSPTYSEPLGGWTWVSGEPFVFDNWSSGEPNNVGLEDYAEMFGNGAWNDVVVNHSGTSSYVIEYGAAGNGIAFCNPMDPNSTGQSTTLTAQTTMATPTGIRLEANQGPATQFGYFLIGTASNDPGIPLGQGRLCLALGGGQSIGRYNIAGTSFSSVGQFDTAGVLLNFAGTSSTGEGYDVPTVVPISGSPSIMSGQTWHFQLWHRENGGQSNFSNGLSLTF